MRYILKRSQRGRGRRQKETKNVNVNDQKILVDKPIPEETYDLIAAELGTLYLDDKEKEHIVGVKEAKHEEETHEEETDEDEEEVEEFDLTKWNISKWDKYLKFLKSNKNNSDIKKSLDKKISKFSYRHYNYINQIFGDEKIRNMIDKLKLPSPYDNPKKDWKFDVVEHSTQGSHHILQNKKNEKEKICSVDLGFQNVCHNVYDNLCQSYSILEKFDSLTSKYTPIKWKWKKDYDGKMRALPRDYTHANQIARRYHKIQMDMINISRTILQTIKEKETLFNEFKEIISTQKSEWKAGNLTHESVNTIIENIEKTLNEWETYGYIYFIGDPQYTLTGIRTEKEDCNTNPTDGGMVFRLKKSHKKKNRKSNFF